MSALVRCSECGGTVVYDIDVEGAACMFCGTVALKVEQSEEEVPVPGQHLPVEVDRQRADGQFRKWARASWWYPKVLRDLDIKLNLLLLPAWRFKCHLETHWAGLERANTRSGKRPTSGKHQHDARCPVPASGGVSQTELMELEPYDDTLVQPFDARAVQLPYEPPQLSERAARLRAHDILTTYHRRRIMEEEGLTTCNVSPVIDDLDVRLMVVPVHIGAFTFRGVPWRFLINAQTGKVVGKAPIDRLKVLLVSGGVMLMLVALGVIISLATGA